MKVKISPHHIARHIAVQYNDIYNVLDENRNLYRIDAPVYPHGYWILKNDCIPIHKSFYDEIEEILDIK